MRLAHSAASASECKRVHAVPELSVAWGHGICSPCIAAAYGLRRYALSDEKTFSSLFHPEKEAILRLIDAFVRKDGKYAIPGYGHKLGLLLHGPPGTGKTSLIKAR